MKIEKCPICGWKLQKRARGLVCKNWKCYKYFKGGETIEEYWRREGIIGRCWIGNRIWEITPSEIKEVKDQNDNTK